MSVRCLSGVLHLFCLCQVDILFWLCLLNEPFLPSHVAADEFNRDEADVANRMRLLIPETTLSGYFFADFTKGFDVIDHSVLLDELKSFDIDKTLHDISGYAPF